MGLRSAALRHAVWAVPVRPQRAPRPKQQRCTRRGGWVAVGISTTVDAVWGNYCGCSPAGYYCDCAVGQLRWVQCWFIFAAFQVPQGGGAVSFNPQYRTQISQRPHRDNSHLPLFPPGISAKLIILPPLLLSPPQPCQVWLQQIKCAWSDSPNVIGLTDKVSDECRDLMNRVRVERGV